MSPSALETSIALRSAVAGAPREGTNCCELLPKSRRANQPSRDAASLQRPQPPRQSGRSFPGCVLVSPHHMVSELNWFEGALITICVAVALLASIFFTSGATFTCALLKSAPFLCFGDLWSIIFLY
ncbi:hypothetical protein NN561_008798 [Cricetulus griseus]